MTRDITLLIASSLLGSAFAADEPTWIGRYPDAVGSVVSAYEPVRHEVVLWSGETLNYTWVWNGSVWTQKTPVYNPPPRASAAMERDVTPGQVMLFGGYSPQLYPVPGIYRNDTWVWDGVNWNLKSTPVAPPPRFGHAMAYDAARGQVVLFGGNGASQLLGDTWVWDGTAWTQKTPASSPGPRQSHAMAYDSVRQRVVLFGGDNNSYADTNETWEWDGNNWTQASPSAAPHGHSGHRMVFDSTRNAVLMFWQNSGGYSPDASELWAWDGVRWLDLTQPGGPSSRSDFAVAFDGFRGNTVMFGGLGPSGLGLNDTWKYSASGWTYVPPPYTPQGRTSGAMASDLQRAQVVLFGGSRSGVLRGDTWVWDGAVWAQKTPALTPSARQGHAMAYDATRKETVLFGGSGAGYLGDTWTWNGVNWTLKASASSPPARSSAAMAYDAARGQVVLYGGSGQSGSLSDTWVWDGVTWTNKTPGLSPSLSDRAAMAYDEQRGEVVLFGTSRLLGTPTAETWVWNGTTWTLKSPASQPSPRTDHTMAYDSARRHLVLFGGSPNGGYTALDDTWIWDGSNWSAMTPLARPAGRRDAAMAYDPVLRQVLLFGGIPTGYGVELADSWLWVGGVDASPLTVVTVSGNPSRCSIAVDGTTFASPHAFTWVPGSLHTIAAPSHQPDTGTRCTFTSWSDGGAVSHQVTAPATATTLVATFGTQYKLTLSVTPGGAGAVTPSPASGDGFYTGGTDVVLTAMPRAGQYLSNVQVNYSWVGIQNPWTVTLSGPVQVTAQFSQISSFGPSAAAVLGTTAGTIVWDMFDDSLPPDESGVGFTGKPSASRSGAQLIVSRNTYSQLALLEYQAYYPNKFNVYTLGGSFQGDPAIAAGENYSDMYAAVRDYSNGYWLIHVSYPSSAPDWTFLGGQFATDPVMARAADGTIYIAGKDNWQSTWVGRYTALTGFKGWKNLGGILRSKLALTVGQDGIAYIAGVDPWYGMWLMRTQSDQVLGWYPARGVFPGDPSITTAGDGTIVIAGLDSGGGIWHRPFWQGLDAAWKTDWQLAGGTLTNVSAASNDGSPIFAGITPYSRLAWYYPQTNQWQTVVLPHNPTGTLSASPR